MSLTNSPLIASLNFKPIFFTNHRSAQHLQTIIDVRLQTPQRGGSPENRRQHCQNKINEEQLFFTCAFFTYYVKQMSFTNVNYLKCFQTPVHSHASIFASYKIKNKIKKCSCKPLL